MTTDQNQPRRYYAEAREAIGRDALNKLLATGLRLIPKEDLCRLMKVVPGSTPKDLQDQFQG